MFVPDPLTLIYLLAMAAVVALGVIVLAAALLLAILPAYRRAARRLAGGVIGALPFALFFQGLSLPILVAIATIAALFAIWSSPAEGPSLIVATAVAGLMLAVFITASVTGIIAGWAVGARIASGTTVRDALRASRLALR